jgi:hypothetical protein
VGHGEISDPWFGGTGASVFHVRGNKITRLIVYDDAERALAGAGDVRSGRVRGSELAQLGA